MANSSTYHQLTSILREVFDSDNIIATPDLTAKAVEGWDSLGNVRLFVEIERSFSVRFSAAEIGSLKTVGQLADLLERKLHRPRL